MQGRNDPTMSMTGAELWRATQTPEGPASLCIRNWNTAAPVVETHGPGAAWLEPRALDLLGAGDTVPEVTPHHDAVREAQRRFGTLLIGSSHVAYHELLPAVIGQRITGIEAHRQWRDLVRTYGHPAPGPQNGLYVPPPPDTLASLPYARLHPIGIERKRADALRQVARHFDYLTRLGDSPSSAHDKSERLQVIPGVGVWTSAVAGGLAFGDPDALLVGDFHVKNTVAYALTGRIRGTDEEMIATMAPYAGQRHRVVRWLQLSGARAPARGPRRRIVSIARL